MMRFHASYYENTSQANLVVDGTSEAEGRMGGDGRCRCQPVFQAGQMLIHLAVSSFCNPRGSDWQGVALIPFAGLI